MRSILLKDGEIVGSWETDRQNSLVDVMHDIEIEPNENHSWALKTVDYCGNIIALQTADQRNIVQGRVCSSLLC